MYLKKSNTVKFRVQLPTNQANKLKEFKTKANQEGVKLSMNDLIEIILDNFLKTVSNK